MGDVLSKGDRQWASWSASPAMDLLRSITWHACVQLICFLARSSRSEILAKVETVPSHYKESRLHAASVLQSTDGSSLDDPHAEPYLQCATSKRSPPEFGTSRYSPALTISLLWEVPSPTGSLLTRSGAHTFLVSAT